MQRIGKFEVESLLGKGAMGAVYAARDPGLDRSVAVKTISPHLLRDPEALQRFLREARAAARLQHPNIVTVYELGHDGATHFIAMELLDGVDLAQLMRGDHPLSFDRRIDVVLQMCRGLDFAHKRGVIHRDVKPANVRVTDSGTVKIVDFGIARLGDTNLTQTGMVVGTPPYMAPEVLRGQRSDHRCDLWAVGVILYELLSGRRPFEAPTFVTLAWKIVNEPLPPLDARALGLSPALARAVERALAKEPNARFPDLAEMAAALEDAQGYSPSLTLHPEERQGRYQQHLVEAHRMMEAGDFERALEAARMAQAVSPANTEVALLISRLEARLERMPSPTPTPPGLPVPSLATRAPAPPPAAFDVRAAMRAHGAGAFRDEGAFGEPPPNQVVALSPDRLVLAAAGSDGAVRIWDLHARTQRQWLRTTMHRRTGHDARPLGLAFSPDGALVSTSHVDGAVHVWDVASGEELAARLKHEGMAGSVAFAPDGSVLASGGMDATLKLWDVAALRSGEARRELHRQPAGVTAAGFVGGGRWMLTGHVNRILRLQDAVTGRLVATIRGPQAQVHLIRSQPGGRHVAVGSHDRTIRLVDLQSRAEVVGIGPLRGPISDLAFFPDGLVLASVSAEHVVQLWDAETGEALGSVWGPAGESYVGIEVGRDALLVAALADGRVRTWSPALRS